MWLVELPDGSADSTSTSSAEVGGRTSPTAEEYNRLQQLVMDLRHMLQVVTAQLEARREEVAQLMRLLDRSLSGTAPAIQDDLVVGGMNEEP